MEFNLEEIKQLRESVEALRRDVAQLHGRLDVIEDLILPPEDDEPKVELYPHPEVRDYA